METYEFLKNPDPVKNLHFYDELFKKYCKGYTKQVINDGNNTFYYGETYDKNKNEFVVSIWFSDGYIYNFNRIRAALGSHYTIGTFSLIHQQYKYDWVFSLERWKNMRKEFNEIAPIVKLTEVI